MLVTIMLLIPITVIAQLPPPPPATPAGMGQEEQVQEVPAAEPELYAQEDETAYSVPLTESLKITELETRVTNLENKVLEIESSSGFFSTPLIILLSINLALIAVVIYFFVLSRPKEPEMPVV